MFFCLLMSMLTFTIFMTIASFRTKQWETNLRKERRGDLFYREVDRDRDLEGKKRDYFRKKYDGETHRRWLRLRDRCFEGRGDFDRDRVLEKQIFDLFHKIELQKNDFLQCWLVMSCKSLINDTHIHILHLICLVNCSKPLE